MSMTNTHHHYFGIHDGKKFCLYDSEYEGQTGDDWPEVLASGAISVEFEGEERRNVVTKAEYDALAASAVMLVQWMETRGYAFPPKVKLTSEWPGSLTTQLVSGWIEDGLTGAEVSVVEQRRGGQLHPLKQWCCDFVSDAGYDRREAAMQEIRKEMAALAEQNGWPDPAST